MTRTPSMLAFAVASLWGAAALAQTPATAPATAPARDTLFFVANAAPVAQFGGPIRVVGFEGAAPGNVVTGKPYAADAVTESVQVLGDGNRIKTRNEARFMRDSQGRTRREQTVRGFGPAAAARDPVTMITIFDPVAGVSYSLDTAARTARPSRPFKIAAGMAQTFSATAPPPLPPPSAGGTRVMVYASRDVAGIDSGGAPVHFELQAPAGAPAVAGPPTVVSTAPAGTANEDLGEQVLEGVLTRGTRRTITIPAGAMGNERPIEIVSEQWYSPDLAATVLTRNYDPRIGETTYRLVNVVRGEQSPELFTVPQGYTLLPEPWQDQGAVPGGPAAIRSGERGDSAAIAAGRN